MSFPGLIDEQKGYIIAATMTSDPEDLAPPTRDRARFAALLKAPPPFRGYRITASDRRDWDRATEQARRRLLKDCGWL